MAAITTAVLMGVAAAASTASYFDAKKSARKSRRVQEKANRTASVSSQVQNATSRRRAIAQARMAQAQNISSAGGQVQNSSGLAGSNAALGSQLGANVGTQGQQLASQEATFGLRQDAQNIMADSQIRQQGFGAIAGLAQFGAANFSPTSAPSTGGRNSFRQSSVPQSSGFIPSNTPGPR